MYICFIAWYDQRMTKEQLIDEIIRRARYDTLTADQVEATRTAYRRMKKADIQKLLDNPPATWLP